MRNRVVNIVNVASANLERVGAVGIVALVLVLLLHEAWASDVAANDDVVAVALDDLSVRAGDVDLIARAALTTVEQFDSLWRTVDALFEAIDKTSALSLDRSVSDKLQDFRTICDDRSTKIDTIKAARGRLVNIEHYLPRRLEELARLHPDDGEIALLRTLLLGYLLDPSMEHLHAVQAFTEDLKNHSERPLFELYRQLDLFQRTRTELKMIGDDLFERDLRRKSDEVARAHALVVAAHQRRSAFVRLAGLIALVALAGVSIWTARGKDALTAG